jgi:hypothetical protein
VKAGQIIKLTPQGLKNFPPGIRQRLEGQIGLVVQQKYDLSYKLDQSKLPEHIKVYPSLVRFDSLDDLSGIYENAVMVFPDQVEILS